ncbi:hypothetical protein [Rhizobium oryziradicis]|uniref:hypothetical protein n=1 Tax=Rhizobium oryziradicis TaxID=1867956 RepID=UPI000AEEF2DC|nr:hypothetical protein [Rhizobium oryziradicis]
MQQIKSITASFVRHIWRTVLYVSLLRAACGLNCYFSEIHSVFASIFKISSIMWKTTIEATIQPNCG